VCVPVAQEALANIALYTGAPCRDRLCNGSAVNYACSSTVTATALIESSCRGGPVWLAGDAQRSEMIGGCLA